jgi:SAM-dependent methyltransferase
MSGFSAQWLALREPYDRAARNPAVLEALKSAFAGRDTVTVVDLGCGTGATLRAVSALLPARQSWQLVDHDEGLLAEAEARTAGFAPAITTKAVDLAGNLDAVLDNADLVTMSALLDLVSAAWLDRMVGVVAQRRVPIYAALSYDGQVAFTPPSPHDAVVLAAFNRHQRIDKGFGPALGPDAAQAAPGRFRSVGFSVVEGASDWHFDSIDRDIQTEMLTGFAAAAGAMGVSSSILDDWLATRRAPVAAGRSAMRVGHVDFFATPGLEQIKRMAPTGSPY